MEYVSRIRGSLDVWARPMKLKNLAGFLRKNPTDNYVLNVGFPVTAAAYYTQFESALAAGLILAAQAMINGYLATGNGD